MPWSRAVDLDSGRFLPVEALLELHSGLGVSPDKEDVVTYCRIGERGAHSWYVLHELLDYDRVKNHDGS